MFEWFLITLLGFVRLCLLGVVFFVMISSFGGVLRELVYLSVNFVYSCGFASSYVLLFCCG